MNQPTMTARTARRGFTLLELLIVIATILILASILFPIARAASDSANRSACVSNLHQLSQLVTAYRQDYIRYPPPTGMIGLHGVPQEGVSALALANAGLASRDFWCPLDPFESRFAATVNPSPSRDLSSSSYSYGYNYYGLVTTTDGQPFAITSEEAAQVFFDSTRQGDWALGLIEMKAWKPNTSYTVGDRIGPFNVTVAPVMYYCKTAGTSGGGEPVWGSEGAGDLADGSVTWHTGPVTIRPKGLFQGLWNIHAPPDTVMTYCLNHPAEKPRVIPVVTVAGSAVLVKASPLPRNHGSVNYGSSYLVSSSIVNRFALDSPPPASCPDVWSGWWCGDQENRPADKPLLLAQPTIDWRINKAAYRKGNQQNNAMFGDSAGNESATLMPVVETYYRFIDLKAMQTLPIEADGAAWYDTGLECKAGDIIMLRTSAKWNYKNYDRATWPNADYQVLFSEQGLFFNASGDPVEVKQGSYPTTMLLQQYQHGMLVGKIGDTGTIFPMSSTGAYIVKLGETGTLKLTVNIDTTADSPANFTGYCEVWFGLYQP